MGVYRPEVYRPDYGCRERKQDDCCVHFERRLDRLEVDVRMIFSILDLIDRRLDRIERQIGLVTTETQVISDAPTE